MYYIQAYSKKLFFSKRLAQTHAKLPYFVIFSVPNYKPSEYRFLLRALYAYNLRLCDFIRAPIRWGFVSGVRIAAGTVDLQAFLDFFAIFNIKQGNRLTIPFLVLGRNCCAYKFMLDEVLVGLRPVGFSLFFILRVMQFSIFHTFYNAYIPTAAYFLAKTKNTYK